MRENERGENLCVCFLISEGEVRHCGKNGDQNSGPIQASIWTSKGKSCPALISVILLVELIYYC